MSLRNKTWWHSTYGKILTRFRGVSRFLEWGASSNTSSNPAWRRRRWRLLFCQKVGGNWPPCPLPPTPTPPFTDTSETIVVQKFENNKLCLCLLRQQIEKMFNNCQKVECHIFILSISKMALRFIANPIKIIVAQNVDKKKTVPMFVLTKNRNSPWCSKVGKM